MARKLPEIPKCKVCGRQVLGAGAICRSCQLKRAHEDYQKVVRAEQNMSGDSSWREGYSPWKNIILIPIVIGLLILVAISIIFLSP